MTKVILPLITNPAPTPTPPPSMTPLLRPENWDFSVFTRNWSASDFTRRQLLMANVADYNTKELEDDFYMTSPADGKFPQKDLRLLAFAMASGAIYNARRPQLTFGGGALQIEPEEPAPVIGPADDDISGNLLGVVAGELGLMGKFFGWMMGIRPRSFKKALWPISGAVGTVHTIKTVQKMVSNNNQNTINGMMRAKIRINKNIPNMVINPGSGGVNLPVDNLVAQKIETEGGKDHFHIYVSPEYSTDALYIFSPDVLTVMHQYGSDFAYRFLNNDVEIYAPAKVFESGEMLRNLCFCAVNMVEQINQQAVRYRDERASDDERSAGFIGETGRTMLTKQQRSQMRRRALFSRIPGAVYFILMLLLVGLLVWLIIWSSSS